MLTENDLRPVEWEHKAPERDERWATSWVDKGTFYYASIVRDVFENGVRLHATVDKPWFKQSLNAYYPTLEQAQAVAERWLAGAAALAQGVCGEV